MIFIVTHRSARFQISRIMPFMHKKLSGRRYSIRLECLKLLFLKNSIQIQLSTIKRSFFIFQAPDFHYVIIFFDENICMNNILHFLLIKEPLKVNYLTTNFEKTLILIFIVSRHPWSLPSSTGRPVLYPLAHLRFACAAETSGASFRGGKFFYLYHFDFWEF